MNNSRLLNPIWLHPRYHRMPKHHSAIERVEDLHLRADKLKVKALRVKAINDVMKRKARDGDDGSLNCRKCGEPTHSNDALCVCCEERARLKDSKT